MRGSAAAITTSVTWIELRIAELFPRSKFRLISSSNFPEFAAPGDKYYLVCAPLSLFHSRRTAHLMFQSREVCRGIPVLLPSSNRSLFHRFETFLVQEHENLRGRSRQCGPQA